jgi:putative Ca2+/H+ antiporter (TMEM165/GDT1 family)
VAELGDKSQLMALTFATRYSALTVLIGVSVATLIVHAVSVLIGRSLASVVPLDVITIIAALSFFAFALWTLRGDSLDESDEAKVARVQGSAIVAVGVAFFLAELGDKTMLATVALSTREEPVGTWLGSTVGMVAADALAIVVGRILGKRLPEQAIKYGAAAAFAIFGAILLASVLLR